MKKARRVFFGVLQVLALLLALVLLLPKFLGYRQYTVLTGSMRPTLPVGSMIVVRPAGPDAVEVGDIISFTTAGLTDIVTHRVVEIDGEKIITKGDANNVNDPKPVSGDRLLGTVLFHIPLVGYLALFVNWVGPWTLLLGIAAVYLLVGVLPRLLKKSDAAPDTPA